MDPTHPRNFSKKPEEISKNMCEKRHASANHNIREEYAEILLSSRIRLRCKERKGGEQNSDCQISGKPWYSFRLGCRSDEEPKFCLLEFGGWTVGEVDRVGYVDGSEGS